MEMLSKRAAGLSALMSTARVRTVALAALVVLSDMLFFRHPIGISLALFLFALAVVATCLHRGAVERGEACAGAALLAAALLPLVETVDGIAVAFAFGGTAAAALVLSGNARAGWRESARRVVVLVAADPAGIRHDLRNARRLSKPGTVGAVLRAVVPWAMPLALGSVFVVLFSLANPVFRSWIALLDVRGLFLRLDPMRVLLWVGAGLFVRPFLRMRFSGVGRPAAPSCEPPAPWPRPTLGRAMVVRSLVVFNAVFALETAIDVGHLWGGVWNGAAVPFGVGHAAYAQEAAYLLVFTALLSAAFVLVATRPSGDALRSRLVRWLIHLWIAQNVVLVFSAMLRLGLYVDAYSLTRLRLAAFVWMALVALGLATILVRIVLGLGDSWLIGANLAPLIIVLYASGVVDANRFIADYNTAHAREFDGDGVLLDTAYLCRLGASALPAIDTYLESQATGGRRTSGWFALQACAGRIERDLARTSSDWRGWTFRDHRLRAYAAARYDRLNAGTTDGPHDTRR